MITCAFGATFVAYGMVCAFDIQHTTCANTPLSSTLVTALCELVLSEPIQPFTGHGRKRKIQGHMASTCCLTW